MQFWGAQWIVPIEGKPIRDGVLAVENGRIRRVGHISEFGKRRVQHLGDVAILPGLVNAHCHLELGHLHGKIPPGPFWEWIEQVIAESRTPGEHERRRRSIREGAAASLAGGVTCIGDISRTGLNAEVLVDSPMRKICFIELISAAHAPPNDAGSLIARYETLAALQSERLRIGISPHAPYSVSADDMALAIEFAVQKLCPLTLHYLETAEELSWILQDTPRLSAFAARHALRVNSDSARRNSLFVNLPLHGCRPLLAHGNYLAGEKGQTLPLPAGSSVAFCPRTHHYFGHRPHPWRELLARGINVCLGTDSLASNPSLSILEELRTVRGLARDVSPNLLLEMSTIRGARALSWDHQVGSLKPGKAADFLSIPLEPDCDDPLVAILDGNTEVTQVWIAGEIIHQAASGRG